MDTTYGATTVCEYPSTLLRITSKDLEKMLSEAESLFERGEYIQACEKFYKVIEEVVKILAEFYAPQTMEEVKERINKKLSPWTTKLLYDAVEEIANNLDDEQARIFRNGWRSAMDLHRDCFHDFLLTPSMIVDAIENVKKIVEISKNLLKNIESLLLSSTTVNEFS